MINVFYTNAVNNIRKYYINEYYDDKNLNVTTIINGDIKKAEKHFDYILNTSILNRPNKITLTDDFGNIYKTHYESNINNRNNTNKLSEHKC